MYIRGGGAKRRLSDKERQSTATESLSSCNTAVFSRHQETVESSANASIAIPERNSLY